MSLKQVLRHILRVLNSIFVGATTLVQDGDSIRSLMSPDADKKLVVGASVGVAAACATVDMLTTLALQGRYIDPCAQEVAQPQLAPPRRTALSVVLQASNLVLSLLDAGCDRYFILSSLVDLFEQLLCLLRKIELPEASALKTDPAFLSAVIFFSLIAYSNRVCIDGFAANELIAKKCGDTNPLPIQAGFLRFLGRHKRLLRAAQWMGNGDSSFFDDSAGLVFLPSVLLQMFRYYDELSVIMKVGLSAGLGLGLALASWGPNFIRARSFDRLVSDENVAKSLGEALTPQKQEVTRGKARLIRGGLEVGAALSTLATVAPAMLALSSFITYLKDDQPEPQEEQFTLYPILMLIMTILNYLGLHFSEVNQTMEGLEIREGFGNYEYVSDGSTQPSGPASGSSPNSDDALDGVTVRPRAGFGGGASA